MNNCNPKACHFDFRFCIRVYSLWLTEWLFLRNSLVILVLVSLIVNWEITAFLICRHLTKPKQRYQWQLSRSLHFCPGLNSLYEGHPSTYMCCSYSICSYIYWWTHWWTYCTTILICHTIHVHQLSNSFWFLLSYHRILSIC